MTRTIIFSDIHGCIDEFNDLIAKAGVTINDKIVYAGDLVDKGPYSAEVVARARELAKTNETVLVDGNHEHKHKRFRKHISKGTGNEKKMKNWEELADITAKLSKKDIAFLNTGVLYHQIPEHNILVVHAGVSPSIDWLPSHNDLKKMSKKKLKHFEQMLRVRYVNPKGYMVSLGHETDDDVYWADIYDGRYGKVIFGHQPFYIDEPKQFKHATGIDLGCVFGNKLCAVILTEGSIDYVMVDAKNKYAKKMGEE